VNLLILLLLGTLSVAQAAEPQKATVIVPVADVWSRPLAPGEKPSDELRETQILSGEKVVIHESSGPWVRIEAIEQPEYTHHNRWEGYPGWTLAAAIQPPSSEYMSTTKLEIKTSRKGILSTSNYFLGERYIWGGLTGPGPVEGLSPISAKDAGTISYGIDCSGFVHLTYRMNGLKVPRDSYEQWMKAKPIKRIELKPADLIFSAKAINPKKITHVALYVGDGQIIEAPQTGMVVRKISFKEKYGEELEKVESGDTVGDRVIYFGSYF